MANKKIFIYFAIDYNTKLSDSNMKHIKDIIMKSSLIFTLLTILSITASSQGTAPAETSAVNGIQSRKLKS